MKLFIVAALLVASVAGQSLDVLKLNGESNSLFKYNRPLVGNELFSGLNKRLLGHPLERSFIYGDNVEVPSYLQDEIVDTPVYQLEELTTLPLFREYLTYPLFRNFIQYPAFQRFVASEYFQRFFEIPAYKQYFINPVLFYKYVYPLVSLFKTDVTYPTISTHGYNYNYNVEDLYRNRNDFVVPSVYNYNQELPIYSQSLVDRIYRHLNLNNVNTFSNHGRLQGLLTDVQLNPEGLIKENTFGKIVDPITGHVKLTAGDAKLVSEKVIPVDTIYQEQNIRNVRDFYNYNYNKYDVLPTANKVNPLVARLLQGYNYGRFPAINQF